MTDITHNIRNRTIILNDDRQIHITQGQKDALVSMINDKLPLVEVNDIDTGNCLFSGKRTSIKEFRQKKIDGAKYNVICPKGGKHPLYDGEYTCNCV